MNILAAGEFRSRQRCDGCGEETLSPEQYFDGDDLLGTYCPGCDLLLEFNDIEPGDHEQFKLEDGLDRNGGAD